MQRSQYLETRDKTLSEVELNYLKTLPKITGVTEKGFERARKYHIFYTELKELIG